MKKFISVDANWAGKIHGAIVNTTTTTEAPTKVMSGECVERRTEIVDPLADGLRSDSLTRVPSFARTVPEV
jgi:hypothetical protein